MMLLLKLFCNSQIKDNKDLIQMPHVLQDKVQFNKVPFLQQFLLDSKALKELVIQTCHLQTHHNPQDKHSTLILTHSLMTKNMDWTLKIWIWKLKYGEDYFLQFLNFWKLFWSIKQSFQSQNNYLKRKHKRLQNWLKQDLKSFSPCLNLLEELIEV